MRINGSNLLIIINITIFSFCFNACKEDPCKDVKKEDLERPELSAEYLKWVKVVDTTPTFKVTYFDAFGNITQVDTIVGIYKFTQKDKQFILNDCAVGYYKQAENYLSLKLLDEDFRRGFAIDNYKRKNGFSGYIVGLTGDNEYINEATKLDTLTVNGHLYNDVYILTYGSPTFKYAYVKSIGFIYIRSAYQIELIP